MKRFAVLSALALLITACAVPGKLAPSEVLARAASAHRDLSAARFTLYAMFQSEGPNGKSFSGEVQSSGILQNGGKQLQFDAEGEGGYHKDGSQQGRSDWKAGGEGIMLSEDEIYTKLSEWSFDPPDALFSSPAFLSLLHTWWRMPTRQSSDGADVTPDPQMLRMQMQVVNVVADKGSDTVNGSEAYHYAVSIDPQKLSEFLQTSGNGGYSNVSGEGELWIDAKTFVLRKAVWKIHTEKGETKNDINLVIDLYDVTDNVAITPPKDARTLPENFLTDPMMLQVTPLE